MKRNLLLLVIVMMTSSSSFSQTVYSMATGSVNRNAGINTESTVKYKMADYYGSPLPAKFKSLGFDIKPNPEKGMLTLTINSPKHFSFLLTIENGAGDVLIFEEVELHEGMNIIPFATNNSSVNGFDLKLSEIKSAGIYTISMVKQY